LSVFRSLSCCGTISLAHVWEEDSLSRAVLGVWLFEVPANGLYQIPRNISFDSSDEFQNASHSIRSNNEFDSN
jgi:hypothetical protein